MAITTSCAQTKKAESNTPFSIKDEAENLIKNKIKDAELVEHWTIVGSGALGTNQEYYFYDNGIYTKYSEYMPVTDFGLYHYQAKTKSMFFTPALAGQMTIFCIQLTEKIKENEYKTKFYSNCTIDTNGNYVINKTYKRPYNNVIIQKK
jgi:hypothetical protein